MDYKSYIEEGRAIVGLELGSTRIKAVLIDDAHKPIASGSYSWENQLRDGIWTYSLDAVHEGIQACYKDLVQDIQNKYGTTLRRPAAIGISAMMHGYLPFDKDGNQICMFRTWRNLNASKAAALLSELFRFNIPDRWSLAHLYQSILDQEEHVQRLAYLTTLGGYIHWRLTGEKVIGIGDASGMAPIDETTLDYDQHMLDQFEELIAPMGYPWRIRDVLPKVLAAGQNAGCLTEEGARFLDPSGNLEAGIPMAPPEGDAQTGMIATNSIAKRTGNVSAGTSGFINIVLENRFAGMHRAVEIIQTPDGSAVGMIHANTCTSDLNAWVALFGEFAALIGNKIDTSDLFRILYTQALKGDVDCGGLTSYGYYSGERVTEVPQGRPMLVRKPTDQLSVANLMRSHLFSSVAVIRIGVEIMQELGEVKIDRLMGHGGLFKTKGVGQRIVAAAMNSPVTVMETAGEGGAWGIALLAAYLVRREEGETLPEYLDKRVFMDDQGETVEPDPVDVEGFNQFLVRYKAGLAAERAAAEIDT